MNQSLFYTSKNGQELGPFPGHEIESLLNSGQLSESDFIYIESKEDWITLQEFRQNYQAHAATAQVIAFAPSAEAPSHSKAAVQDQTILVDFPTDHRYEFSPATQTSIPTPPIPNDVHAPPVLTKTLSSTPPTQNEAPSPIIKTPDEPLSPFVSDKSPSATAKELYTTTAVTTSIATTVPLSAAPNAITQSSSAVENSPTTQSSSAVENSPTTQSSSAVENSPTTPAVFELTDVPSGDFQISLRYLPTQTETTLPIHVDAGEAQEIKVVLSNSVCTADLPVKMEFFALDRFGSIDSHHTSQMTLKLSGVDFAREYRVDISHGIASWVCEHKTSGNYKILVSSANGLKVLTDAFSFTIEPGTPKTFELKTRENLRAGEPIQIQVVGKDEWGNICTIDRDQLKIELIPHQKSS